MTSLVFWRQALSSSARSLPMASALSVGSAAEQVVCSVGSATEVVEFALGAGAAGQRFDRSARRAVRDVPRQVQQRPRRVVLDVAVLLGANRAYRVERVVIGLGGVDLGASGLARGVLAQLSLRAKCPRSRVGNVDAKQVEQRGHQVDTAEQLVVNLWTASASPRRAHDERDAGARVVEGGLGPRQRRAVVGHEHHPGGRGRVPSTSRASSSCPTAASATAMDP